MILVVILVSLLFVFLGGIVLFLLATATGTTIGIIAGITKGVQARRAARAGTPRLPRKEARALRIADLNATIHPNCRNTAIPGPRHAANQEATRTARAARWENRK